MLRAAISTGSRGPDAQAAMADPKPLAIDTIVVALNRRARRVVELLWDTASPQGVWWECYTVRRAAAVSWWLLRAVLDLKSEDKLGSSDCRSLNPAETLETDR